MKTHIYRFRLIGMLFLVSTILGSCTKPTKENHREDPHPIIGEWMMVSLMNSENKFDGEVAFLSDGTFRGSELNGTKHKGEWSITDDGNLRTEYILKSGFVAKEWSLVFSGDECRLTNVHEGWSMKYVRKK